MRFTDSRVYVVGGGPSLQGFHFAALNGKTWIGCNYKYRHDPTVVWFMDKSFIRAVQERNDWRTCPSTKIGSIMEVDFPLPADVWQIRNTRLEIWTRGVLEGCPAFNNSGSGAIWLADVLDAAEILLLGFDLHGHPEWRHEIETFVAPNVRAKVFNLNPDSALTCFEKVPLGARLQEICR